MLHEKLTESDVKKIQEEIEHRKLVIRKEALESVKEARAHGDLSENFEYKAAKQYKNKNESRIRYLEKMLKNAEIIEDLAGSDEVGLNKVVKIYIPEDEEEEGAEPEMITVNGEQKPMRSIMPLAFINPELEPYGKQYLFTEGCLSVRGIRANVARPEFVKARLTLLDGSVLELDCGGLLARCLQHECDHLDGFLYVDRVSSAAKITLAKKLKKLAATR